MADLNTFINIGANTANFVGDITATNLGNVSALDLNGNANTVLAGDGSWVAQSGGGFTNGLDASYANIISTTSITGFVNFDNGPLGDNAIVVGTNATNANVKIVTDNSGNAQSWVFDATGNVTIPRNIIGVAGGYDQPNFIQPNSADSNWTFGISSDLSANFWMQAQFYGQNQATRGFRVLEAEGNTVVFSVNGQGAANVYAMNMNQSITWPLTSSVYEDSGFLTVQGNAGVGLNSTSNASITVGSYIWTFDTTGNLTLPGGTVPVGNAQYDLGTTTATFRDAYFSGTINATEFRNTQGALTAGIDAVGINANAGNSVYLYADGANVGWNFDTTGNLTLPGNTFAVNYANGTPVSLGGGGSYGDSNVVTLLSSYGNNSISTTGNVNTGNIVASGSVNVDYYLTVESPPGGSEGGQITLAWANTSNITGQSNSTWNLDVDSGNTFRVFYQDAGGNAGVMLQSNTTAVNINGTTTVTGTLSNVTRRAFGLVAADVNVTLDDISANVSSSTSQLCLSTSGSWQGTGWTETFTSGTPSVQQWVNLPLSSGFTSASGAMNSQGQGCRCVISDQTPSAKVYQITAVRSGTSGALWNISIERLV